MCDAPRPPAAALSNVESDTHKDTPACAEGDSDCDLHDDRDNDSHPGRKFGRECLEKMEHTAAGTGRGLRVNAGRAQSPGGHNKAKDRPLEDDAARLEDDYARTDSKDARDEAFASGPSLADRAVARYRPPSLRCACVSV